MWHWIVGGVLMGGVVALSLAVRHSHRRRRALQELAGTRAELVARNPVQIISVANRRLLSSRFERERLVKIDQFLAPDSLRSLRNEAESNFPRMVSSYIPTHKKGKTLSYENIQRYAPRCLSLYHSRELRDWISEITDASVLPTPDWDQSSLSILCYNEAGDHINWHFDHNFYRGRHFTVLLSLANESVDGGLSRSQLTRMTATGEEIVETGPNVLVVFEGAKVLHRASPTVAGDLRIILSMTYCTDPHTSIWKEAARRIKDTAFFGVRALWD